MLTYSFIRERIGKLGQVKIGCSKLRAEEVPIPGGAVAKRGGGAEVEHDDDAIAAACLQLAASDAAAMATAASGETGARPDAAARKKKALRRLMLRWHPDKFLAAHRDVLASDEDASAVAAVLNGVALVLAEIYKRA